ncbi:hypothetical protein HK098_006607 [Nowakowskiella sp. JEL0407]|nr:hypothetical protein HK098_006607 [Nowakowskiella sp. JEL0407]
MTLTSILTQIFTSPNWSPNQLPDLSGKVAIVTGASSGIGKQTALQLAKKGACVFCVGWNQEKTTKVIEEIIAESNNTNVEFLYADFLDLESVEKCVEQFLEKGIPLDILINNAGICNPEFYWLKCEGIEAQLATNYLGVVVFTNKLLPMCLASKSARIVNVGSYVHTRAKSVDYENINDEKFYDRDEQYAQTKLANLHFTRTLQKRLSENKIDHVYANVVHPGLVITDMTFSGGQTFTQTEKFMMHRILICPEHGALNSLYAAGSLDIETRNIKGKYIVPYTKVANPSKAALDDEQALKTWNWTESILKSKFRDTWKWDDHLEYDFVSKTE